MSLQLLRPRVVPYITARHGEEGEVAAMLGVLPGGRGLCYLDEGPRDRDGRGVLWARCTQALEGGEPADRPRWREVHPSRQRETMESLRCQVCVRPANRTPLGFLFLETLPAESDTTVDRYEGVLTAQPPLCLEHAQAAAEQCGHLAKKGAVALRVRVPRLYGVIGAFYRNGTHGPEPVDVSENVGSRSLSYRDRRWTPWILASQLVRELRGVTIVNLEEEMAAADTAPRPAAQDFAQP